MNKYTYEQRCEVYDAAVGKWGLDNQLYVAIEEMSEVIKAITKLQRINTPHNTPQEYCDAQDHLAEEIADATIMLEQLQYFFGINDEVCEAMDDKVLRLKDRVVNG